MPPVLVAGRAAGWGCTGSPSRRIGTSILSLKDRSPFVQRLASEPPLNKYGHAGCTQNTYIFYVLYIDDFTFAKAI